MILIKNYEKYFKKFLSNKFISSKLVKLVLKTHNATYKLAAFFGSSLQGYHPKHDIIKYEEWFNNNIIEDDVVLDIGCNTGMMTQAMSSRAKYVYGIEIEKKYIKIARELRQKKIFFIYVLMPQTITILSYHQLVL